MFTPKLVPAGLFSCSRDFFERFQAYIDGFIHSFVCELYCVLNIITYTIHINPVVINLMLTRIRGGSLIHTVLFIDVFP